MFSVLDRIENVIPLKFVNQKIIVDDRSTDATREIAKNFDWKVIPNEGVGISDGANTALKHVETEYFISLEQDLVLSSEWWGRVPMYLLDAKVAIANGIRICKDLEIFSKIEEFAFEKYRKRQNVGKFDLDKFLYGKTLDNTIYKTEIIRRIGGFPKLSVPAGVDNVLAYRTYLAGYRWLVDYDVKSIHLRKDIWDELNHRYWYGTCFDGLSRALGIRYPNMNRHVLRFLFSPIRGLQIGITKSDIRATYIYPLIRFNVLRGISYSRKHKEEFTEHKN